VHARQTSKHIPRPVQFSLFGFYFSLHAFCFFGVCVCVHVCVHMQPTLDLSETRLVSTNDVKSEGYQYTEEFTAL
jgi:hypothetical protein